MATKQTQNSGFSKTSEFCEICGGKNFWISVYGGDWHCLSCDAPPFEGMVARTHREGEWSWWDVMSQEDMTWLARPLYTPNQAFYSDMNSPIMSYGKYKGEPVTKIGRIKRDYLEWIWKTKNETVEVMREIGRLLGKNGFENNQQPFW